MNKKRWILIILALLIWVTCACFLLPWKIWSDCQDKIDACVEAQKEWVNQICPTDCNHYEENFVVGVNSQEEFIQEAKEPKEDKDDEEDKEPEEAKTNEEIKDLTIEKPERKKFEEKRREEPESTGATKSGVSSMIEAETEKDCPEGEVLRCPMWTCLNEETGEYYPCQFRCFCVSPNMYF